MCRKTRTCCGRVGLNGVTLIEQALVEELLQKPPQCLDIFVVVGDIRVVHIHPVTHLLCQVLPYVGELHHLLAAGAVVLLDRDCLADILLGDAELLLHTQLYGQTVCVPTRLTVYEVTLLCLVAADNILDGAGHHVVNTRHTVS